MAKYTVGRIMAKYAVVLETDDQKRIYSGHQDKLQFMAYSVGNELGQVAIFPTDDFGEQKALEMAEKFCNLLNSEVTHIL